MQTYRLAIIGFGNVGQGFASILRDRGEELAQKFGARFQIVAVCDFLKGSVHDPKGISPAVLAACDEAAAIPMPPTVDSLNVGSAAAVFLYEANRQRKRM